MSALSKAQPIVTEPKYDGERIMIHKQGNKIMLFTRYESLLLVLNTTTMITNPINAIFVYYINVVASRCRECFYPLFFRNCKDYTNEYGYAKRLIELGITKSILADEYCRINYTLHDIYNILIGFNIITFLFRCIIDGELMSWNCDTNSFQEFGSNKRTGTGRIEYIWRNIVNTHPILL